MEPGSREEKNALAFLDHLAGVGGHKLRPVSYLTLEQVALLELRLAGGDEARATLDANGLQDEIHTYLFLQAAPLPVVSRAVRAFRRLRAGKARAEAFEEFIVEHVEPFLATLAPEDKADLAASLESLDQIGAAQVTPVPPPGQKREHPDPNS